MRNKPCLSVQFFKCIYWLFFHIIKIMLYFYIQSFYCFITPPIRILWKVNLSIGCILSLLKPTYQKQISMRWAALILFFSNRSRAETPFRLTTWVLCVLPRFARIITIFFSLSHEKCQFEIVWRQHLHGIDTNISNGIQFVKESIQFENKSGKPISIRVILEWESFLCQYRFFIGLPLHSYHSKIMNVIIQSMS